MNENLFLKFPVIKTERLILRMLNLSDLEELYQLYNSESTQKYQGRQYYSKQYLIQKILNQEVVFKRGTEIIWAIERVSDQEFIGIRILYNDENNEFVEIQGDTKQKYWRQGYTKEAYNGILKYLKENKVKGVYSSIQSKNIGATSLVESLNFKKIREDTYEDGLIFDTYILIF